MVGRKRRYEVEILGTRYPVVSNRDERHVREVARLVDESAKRILSSRSGSSSLDAAILTALNFADAYLDTRQSEQEVKQELGSRITHVLRMLDDYLKATEDPAP